MVYVMLQADRKSKRRVDTANLSSTACPRPVHELRARSGASGASACFYVFRIRRGPCPQCAVPEGRRRPQRLAVWEAPKATRTEGRTVGGRVVALQIPRSYHDRIHGDFQRLIHVPHLEEHCALLSGVSGGVSMGETRATLPEEVVCAPPTPAEPAKARPSDD